MRRVGFGGSGGEDGRVEEVEVVVVDCERDGGGGGDEGLAKL